MKRICHHQRRAQRQHDAIARDASCAAIGPQQRLMQLNNAGFTAKREREKLHKQIKALG